MPTPPRQPDRDEDAAAFVKLLLEASQQRELPIYVVLTMRSDYIGDCARYRGLPEAVTNGLYLIPRMTPRAAARRDRRAGAGRRRHHCAAARGPAAQ